jgi:benzoyl-CoA reductase/2-hydroxyglutaryl-CoA dehydratase subunit BcrC/BadD/HgdB
MSGHKLSTKAGQVCAPPNRLDDSPLKWFEDMVDHCLDHVETSRRQGRPLVGIMCEFTPREVIMAAGAVPVCLCGGSAETIPAAERMLPSNLCPLIKSTLGYHLLSRNPFLKQADLLVAETTCDGKKKMFELLAQSKAMHVLELPQKSGEPQALANWTAEIGRFRDFLEQRFDVRVTPDKLHHSIRLMNRERRLRRQLADLMASDLPPLTGRQLLEMKSLISGLEADLAQYEKAIEIYGNGAAAPGSPRARSDQTPPVRVLLTGVPTVHGAERVVDLIEQSGAVVVAQENCTGLKPILEDVDEETTDPVAAIASKYYHLPCSVMTPNTGRLSSLRTVANRFRPDCVVELVWQACLTYDVESWRVRKWAEEEARLPYLKITTDYGPSDSARIASRLEALVETARGRGAAKRGGRVLLTALPV